MKQPQHRRPGNLHVLLEPHQVTAQGAMGRPPFNWKHLLFHLRRCRGSESLDAVGASQAATSQSRPSACPAPEGRVGCEGVRWPLSLLGRAPLFQKGQWHRVFLACARSEMDLGTKAQPSSASANPSHLPCPSPPCKDQVRGSLPSAPRPSERAPLCPFTAWCSEDWP